MEIQLGSCQQLWAGGEWVECVNYFGELRGDTKVLKVQGFDILPQKCASVFWQDHAMDTKRFHTFGEGGMKIVYMFEGAMKNITITEHFNPHCNC